MVRLGVSLTVGSARMVSASLVQTNGSQRSFHPSMNRRIFATRSRAAALGAEFVAVPEAGHLPFVERPDAVREVLAAVLTGERVAR